MEEEEGLKNMHGYSKWIDCLEVNIKSANKQQFETK